MAVDGEPIRGKVCPCIPAAEAPNEVRRLIERRDAEEKYRQVDRARVEAFDERNHRRTIVRNIEEKLANMPVTLTSRHDESSLQDWLKEAHRQLADAETALKKAEAASESARKAIP